MVNYSMAASQELDDAARYSFGLLRLLLSLFYTCRMVTPERSSPGYPSSPTLS